MTLEVGAFRETLGLFTTGVTVVAASTADGIHAMTANAFTSVSLDPMLVLVCVGKQARIGQLLADFDQFSVNVLRADQTALSSYFAGAWREPKPPPFRFVPWAETSRLEGCSAALGCRVHERLEGGDHWILIGRVAALHRGVEPLDPLVFYRGRYRRLAKDEGTAAPDLVSGTGPAQPFFDSW
jgi:flavin reductase (DIM6/NTAB) family NADH-FMN oxidoreductase RutF